MIVTVGLSVKDLEFIDYSTFIDMIIERGNDSHQYNTLATQEDFDRF